MTTKGDRRGRKIAARGVETTSGLKRRRLDYDRKMLVASWSKEMTTDSFVLQYKKVPVCFYVKLEKFKVIEIFPEAYGVLVLEYCTVRVRTTYEPLRKR